MSEEDVLHEWYYQLNGREVGPISTAEIKQLLFGREISRDTYIWRDGFTDWMRVRETDLRAARVRLQSQNDQPAEPDQDAARETLGGFTRDDDSFAEAAVSAETNSPGYDDWYYVVDGEKKGPVSAVAIKNLLNNKDIAADTHVWRKGIKDWCTIRESELHAFVDSEPPPLSSELVNNSLVWIIAILPLVISLVDASLVENNAQPLKWYHIMFINIPFLTWDARRLNRAGYNSGWILGAGLIFIPVYLFLRAKMLKQSPAYGIVWIICLVLAVLIDSN
jgi:GYF domain 2